jgi:hypothetical protein
MLFLKQFNVVCKFLVLPALVIAALIWVGIAHRAQSASSSNSSPVIDMSAADVVDFLREQGLQSLVDKIPDEMDGPAAALLEFVKWHDEMACQLQCVQRVMTTTSIGISFRGL